VLPRRTAARPRGGKRLRVIALDVGSSSVRAVAYDEQGDAEPGDARLAYADDDADRLVTACRAVLAQVGEGDVLAISAFWHSLVPLDGRDRPLGPMLTWRDTRGHPTPLEPEAYHLRTGCFLHPAFWPAKLLRLAVEGVRPARFVSFADYLLLRLTGELQTAVSMASGTGLYDPNRLDWDEETLAVCGVEREQLPLVSDEPVAGVFPALGDGACSNVGVGAVEGRRVALTIGTSGAARIVYGADAAEAKPGIFLYRLDDHRFCEGGAFSDGGNLHAWLKSTLGDFDASQLAERPAAAHGLVFLPFLGGERSLGWDPSRRGLVQGLSFATTPLDLVQAALEGICYRFAAVLDVLGDVGSVVVTGGALLANPAWVQVLADVLGRPLEVSAAAEGSARGAALVALERLGFTIPPAPVARVVESRADRHEIHELARRAHELLMHVEEDT
jgi:gluconokinase